MVAVLTNGKMFLENPSQKTLDAYNTSEMEYSQKLKDCFSESKTLLPILTKQDAKDFGDILLRLVRSFSDKDGVLLSKAKILIAEHRSSETQEQISQDEEYSRLFALKRQREQGAGSTGRGQYAPNDIDNKLYEQQQQIQEMQWNQQNANNKRILDGN